MWSQPADFEKNYKALVERLNSDDRAGADSLCKLMLHESEGSSPATNELKVLRYMHVFATAGLLNENRITQEEAQKAVAYLKGRR